MMQLSFFEFARQCPVISVVESAIKNLDISKYYFKTAVPPVISPVVVLKSTAPVVAPVVAVAPPLKQSFAEAFAFVATAPLKRSSKAKVIPAITEDDEADDEAVIQVEAVALTEEIIPLSNTMSFDHFVDTFRPTKSGTSSLFGGFYHEAKNVPFRSFQSAKNDHKVISITFLNGEAVLKSCYNPDAKGFILTEIPVDADALIVM
jgi:hypothetical protein